ncbi:MAG TPA: stage II sporulation protein R [Clostridia bacterium]|nr:stage II sporulation protein R [Clostridia bacterium]HHY05912.1 stage II sporulation protein R [Clostridia bacterium]
MKMKKRFVGGIVVFLVLTIFCCLLTTKTKTPPLIRLHILANSDSQADQALKYKVRDELIKIMQEEFSKSQSIEESRSILLSRLPFLAEKAEEYVAREGFAYPVQAVYGKFKFPRRDYGAFVLPAGRYEALRLVLGEGKGANWWCVLFPPLCFIEGEQSLCLESEGVKILEQGELGAQKVQIKPAFKIVEAWQEIFKGKCK